MSSKSNRRASTGARSTSRKATGSPAAKPANPKRLQNEVASDEQNAADEGRYAYEGLDRVLHEKARLGIVTSLAARTEGILFGDLKALCNLTDGNLSRHLTVLQDADIVAIQKGYRGRRPQTLCQLTEEGRRRYLAYIAVLESVLDDATGAARGGQNARRMPDGWSPA
ncbi:MAG: transcriptional regulator [bacterium]|nr:transcriptional regulator [bacterium]